ncbi:MAG: hypothetical protein QM817_21750 [Archangium sp.]
MNRLLLLAVFALSAFSACNFTPLPSNDPDSGVSCTSGTTPAGSGSTQGAQQFAVGSSYQRSGQYRDPDSGVVNGAQLDVQLLKKSISCAARADAGPDGDGFFVTVINHASDRISAGTYPVSGHADGGAASFIGLGIFDGGLNIATEGSFTLTTVQNCSVSGSFDVQFGQSDGGAVPFSGTFSSEYCLR